MEKVVELLKKFRELKKIEQKTREVREAFIRVFGVEPDEVTINRAKAIIADGETAELAEQTLRELGFNPRYVDVELYCSRTSEKDSDWKLNEYGIGVHKYENGFHFMLRIRFEERDDDC